jgi:hypothetical protein
MDERSQNGISGLPQAAGCLQILPGTWKLELEMLEVHYMVYGKRTGLVQR